MQNQQGFTLLEVLFALTILAIGLLALATAFPASYMSMSNAHVRENAMRVVENGLEYVKTLRYEEINDSILPDEEVIDVDQDGIEHPGLESRSFQVLLDYPGLDMKTVIVTVKWASYPRRTENGEFVTESTSATVIFDRYF